MSVTCLQSLPFLRYSSDCTRFWKLPFYASLSKSSPLRICTKSRSLNAFSHDPLLSSQEQCHCNMQHKPTLRNWHRLFEYRSLLQPQSLDGRMSCRCSFRDNGVQPTPSDRYFRQSSHNGLSGPGEWLHKESSTLYWL